MVVDNERINNRFREGYNKLRVIDVATKTGTFYPVAEAPRQISDRDEGAAVLSPDGSKVAFIMDSVLHVMPVNADGSPAGPGRGDHAPRWPTCRRGPATRRRSCTSRPTGCARSAPTAAAPATSR